MKKTSKYVDGFLIPVPKKKLDAYLKMAKLGAKVWMDHGALSYVECVSEDVKPGDITSFPQAVQLKKGEVIFFSWTTYKSRKHRDAVMKKVMADPRMDQMMGAMPFDASRMMFGGFKPLVNVESK